MPKRDCRSRAGARQNNEPSHAAFARVGSHEGKRPGIQLFFWSVTRKHVSVRIGSARTNREVENCHDDSEYDKRPREIEETPFAHVLVHRGRRHAILLEDSICFQCRNRLRSRRRDRADRGNGRMRCIARWHCRDRRRGRDQRSDGKRRHPRNRGQRVRARNLPIEPSQMFQYERSLAEKLGMTVRHRLDAERPENSGQAFRSASRALLLDESSQGGRVYQRIRMPASARRLRHASPNEAAPGNSESEVRNSKHSGLLI
jgi:hypothetical protein